MEAWVDTEADRAPMGMAGDKDPEAEMVQFVSFVLDDTQKTWADLFARQGERYQPARLVLFRGSTSSACGTGSRPAGTCS